MSSRNMKMKTVNVILLGLFGLLCVGFGSSDRAHALEWNSILEQAKKEGKVLVNLPTGVIYRPIPVAFQKAFPGIKIDVQQNQGRAFIAKVIAERGAKQYNWDVYVGGTGSALRNLIPRGIIIEMPRVMPETLPGVNDDKWRSGFEFGFYDNKGKYIYAFIGYQSTIITVNRDFISKKELNSLDDLLKPKFKGKIAWYDPTRPGSGVSVVALILKYKGEEFLKKLIKEQKPAILQDGRQLVEWAIRGQYPIALGTGRAMVAPFQKQGLGKNLEELRGEKMSHESAGNGATGLVADAPHPNAALVFINWLLSQKGQTVFSKATVLNTRRLDVPVIDPLSAIDPKSKLLVSGRESVRALKKRGTKIARKLLKK